MEFDHTCPVNTNNIKSMTQPGEALYTKEENCDMCSSGGAIMVSDEVNLNSRAVKPIGLSCLAKVTESENIFVLNQAVERVSLLRYSHVVLLEVTSCGLPWSFVVEDHCKIFTMVRTLYVIL